MTTDGDMKQTLLNTPSFKPRSSRPIIRDAMNKTVLTTLKALACAALLTAPAASSLAQSGPNDAPLPGYWEYKYKVFVVSKTDMKCLTPKDVKRFFDGLCNKGSTCTYSTNDARDGKVKLVGQWIDHKNRHTQVKADGVYTPTSFALKANVTLNSGISLAGTIEGRRLTATCSAAGSS
ncbi:MAG: DUF3617 family protein [Caulobacteraceae bacterium]|nr:MAG: DUF3617 family protein [Caulobacteraceae bacterium]